MGTFRHSEEIPVVILNTGVRLSALGFGSDVEKSAEEIKNAVVSAVRLGYRHFDTSTFHGTQEAIGQGLSEAFRTGLAKREDVFVTSKVADSDSVPLAVKKCLTALQLDYVDLLLLHNSQKLQRGSTFPPKGVVIVPTNFNDSWQAMESCLDEGLTKAIGLSNFTTKELKDILVHAKVVPALIQVELHPMWQQKQLVEFCRSYGIRICAGGPLSVTRNLILKDIAEKHQKTPSQIALRWIVENGIIPIITSYNSDELSDYINIFNFRLSTEDNERIATVEQRRLGLWDPCDVRT